MVDADGAAAGPFGSRMNLDRFAVLEAVQLGTGVRAPTRRALPGDAPGELLDAVMLLDERLDAIDAGAAAPSRTGATWDTVAG